MAKWIEFKSAYDHRSGRNMISYRAGSVHFVPKAVLETEKFQAALAKKQVVETKRPDGATAKEE